MDQVERSRRGEYVDAHVWTFTPSALVEQVVELRELGLHPWRVELVEAPHGLVEFYVVLRRIPRHQDPTAARDDERFTPGDLPDWLELQYVQAARIDELEQQLAALRTRGADAG
jgi:hypothetical protein